MSLVSQKLKQIADKEKAMVVESLENMASHFVTKALDGLPPITDTEWGRRYDEFIGELKRMMDSDKDTFKILVDEYVDDLKAGRVKASTNLISDETMRQLGMLTPKTGEIAAGAAKAMSSKLLKTKTQVSEKDLGIGAEVPPQAPQKSSMMGRMFSAISERLDIMAEKRKTINVETPKLSRQDYMKDDNYRTQILNTVREIQKLGSGASKEQKALLKEVRQMNEHMRFIENPRERMTAGGAAMYDITKAVFGMGKGIVDLLRPAVKEPLSEKTEVAPETPQSVPEHQKQEKKVVQQPDMPLFSRPLRKSLPEDGEVSYIMSHDDEPDDASLEEQSEIETEYREATLGNEEKQIELLEDIDENIKKLADKEEPGDGIKGALGGLLGSLFGNLMKGLGGLFKSAIGGLVTRLLPMLAGFLGPALLPLAGLAAVVGTFMWLKKKTSKNLDDMEPEERAKWDEARAAHQEAESKASNTKYWDDPAHAKQKAAYEKAGFELVDGKWVKKVEGVKKEVAPTLEAKQAVAEEAKAEKENARLAATVSNVVNSPTNTVVAPQARESRTKDSPRNPNNSLARYLDSRIVKFS